MVWKMGPECAAQHAKNVSASTTNCGERSASATPPKGPSAAAPAASAVRGAGRTKNAAGTSSAHARTAMVSCALRQSVQDTSQAANGESVNGATPIPTETSETARLRWRSNHDITAEIIGAKKLPADTPTSTP